jgi:hypothetical protein
MDETNKIRFGIISGRKLLRATKEGDYEEVKKIMSQPVETGGLLMFLLMANDVDGRTALHLAAEYGHKAIVEYLLSHGMKVNLTDLNDLISNDIKKIIQEYDSLKNDA